MKSTGIIRSVDSLGRFVLPKELRDSFGITTDTPIEIFTDGNTILLRKYRADGCCDLCGEVTGDSILFHCLIIPWYISKQTYFIIIIESFKE